MAAAACGQVGNDNVTGRITDENGRPVAGVRVSDGKEIVTTDARGRYRMLSDKSSGMVFVITPSGYSAPCRDGLTPSFYSALTEPADRAEKHDFQLESVDQSRYTALFVTDVHLTNEAPKDDIRYYTDSIAPFLRNTAERFSADGPVYCFNLGDLSHDLYWYRNGHTVADACNVLKNTGFPAPLYSIPGNHDNDPAVTTDNTDFDAGHLFRKSFGPEYYSLDIGGDHYLMLDDVIYVNTPGQGKKTEGVKGARDYYGGFTRAEMDFIRKDLEYVPSSSRVFVCVHCPILKGTSGTYFKDEAQVDTLNSLLSRFSYSRIFAGHAHKWAFVESSRFKGMTNFTFTALSGSMWTTAPDKLLGTHGEAAGLMAMRSSADTVVYQCVSPRDPESSMRIYDMNEVHSYYHGNPHVREYFSAHPGWGCDYGGPGFRNKVYVNCWTVVPGFRLRAFEGGKELGVKKVSDEDPLHFVNYFFPKVAGPFYSDGQKYHSCSHMYSVQAGSPDADIRIILEDASGIPVRDTVFRRPAAFNPVLQMPSVH